MADFVKVASVADVPDPGKLMLEIGERLVVLAHVGGQFFCIDDVCTHDGGPLGEGTLEGYEIACPRHGAKFDVRNGCAKTMPATENTVSHDVKVDGGEIFVRIRESLGDVGGASSEAASSNQTVSSEKSGECCGGTSTVLSASSMSGATVASACSAATAGDASQLCEDHVREELKRVIDPELFVNIVDLGLVYDINLSPIPEGGTKVKIDMTMTSPMCPAGPQLIAQCKQFVGQMAGVGQVEVKIVMDPPWTPEKMTDAARDHLGIF